MAEEFQSNTSKSKYIDLVCKSAITSLKEQELVLKAHLKELEKVKVKLSKLNSDQ